MLNAIKKLSEFVQGIHGMQIYWPDDAICWEREAPTILEENLVEREHAAAALVFPDLPEALKRKEGDYSQENGTRLLLEPEGRREVASRPEVKLC